jgi:thiamine-monophosphate kinase
MESNFIAWLRDRLPPDPRLRLGPGDDAAVLRLGNRAECVATVDLLTDGVDFKLSGVGGVDPRRVGHKALAVNLSDLAAMGARPLAALIAVALPRKGGEKLAVELFEGLLPLAQRFNVALAGGDTNSWDGPLVISITAIGELTQRGPLVRSGAKPGDQIIVTGPLGGSILGRHLDFEPRVNEALLLHERYTLHAGIDISDGLAKDLGHIATESGCGAIVEQGSIPVSDAAKKLAADLNDGSTPLDHALFDGEDFELILAAPPDDAQRMLADNTPLPLGEGRVRGAAPMSLYRIGEFVAEPGLWLVDASGQRVPLPPRGYEHRFE